MFWTCFWGTYGKLRLVLKGGRGRETGSATFTVFKWKCRECRDDDE